MASHNRKNSTLNALRLAKDFFPANWSLDFYLTDDASTDGTVAAVHKLHPEVKVVDGTGDWYWSKSMAAAEASIIGDYEALLWLNDDVTLYKSQFEIFMISRQRYPDSILIGQFCDIKNERINYGGYLKTGRNPLKLMRVQATNIEAQVDAFNGNFVWIPWNVKKALNCIDGRFQHAYGDIDYAYRATSAGVSIYVVPNFIGFCNFNEPIREISRLREIRRLMGPKGLPLQDQWRFHQRHSGMLAPWFSIAPYLRILLKKRNG